MFGNCRWLNEPSKWVLEDGVLRVVTNYKTDFWRETHYGFTQDNGHAYVYQTGAGFTAQLKIAAQYQSKYDQAGMMIRLDEAHWVKAGIEYNDGGPTLSTVVTNDRSDWTTGPFFGPADQLWIRATVASGVLRLQASANGKSWPLIRLCPIPAAPSYEVGPMCCTPARAGLEAAFSEFLVGEPLGKDLHDLS